MAADVTYDPEVDALTISFTAAPTVEHEEVHPGVILHFDATDRSVAIEVLHVRDARRGCGLAAAASCGTTRKTRPM